MLKTSTPLVLGATLLWFSQWMSDVGASEYRTELNSTDGFGAKGVSPFLFLSGLASGLSADCPCPHRSNTKIHLSKVVEYTIQHEGICPLKVLM